MSLPILYSSTETDFDNNGLGILADCISCVVTEEANGIFELLIEYPSDGIHFEEIKERSLIKAEPDQFREPQIFRVYSIKKTISHVAVISAEHISYDLSGIPVSPFSANTAALALAGLKNNAVTECPFRFWTDKTTIANFKVSLPSSIRSRLGGTAGSILDVFGGEFEFDNFDVKLHKSRGENRGVVVRYGKNLIDMKQERNCASVATGIYPYWIDAEGKEFVELPEKIVYAQGKYDFTRIRTVDFSAEFEEKPTVEKLRTRAEGFVRDNQIGVPAVSLTVAIAPLQKSEEYKHLKVLERVSLFDDISVEFPEMGVSASAKVVKIVYDAIGETIKSVTIGSVKSNIADTVFDQSAKITETAKSEANRAVSGQTAESMFDRLTDHGRIQGIYVEGNRWFINAEVARVINLIAEQLSSVSEGSEVRITGAKIKMLSDDKETMSISNEFPGKPIIYMIDYENSSVKSRGEFAPDHIKIGGADVGAAVILGGTGENGTDPYMILGENGDMLSLSWKPNGDGTFTLIGS